MRQGSTQCNDSSDRATDKSGTYSPHRRTFLTTAGATLVAGLAGCSGDGDGSDDTPADGTDSGPSTTTGTATPAQTVDTTFRVYNTDEEDLSTVELNRLNPRYSYTWSFWFHQHWYYPSPTHGGNYFEGFEEVDYDADAGEYTVKIRDNILWHEGSEVLDEFTSEDLMWQWEINHHPDLIGAESPTVENVRTPDDKTMVFEMSDSIHTQSVELAPPLTEAQSGWTYRNGEIVEAFKELKEADEDEKASIKERIVGHKMPTDGTAITCGPWYVENASTQRLDLRRVPGHFLTENEEWNNNWTRARIEKVTGSGNVFQQGLNQDRIDYANDGPPSQTPVESLPEHVTTRLKEGQQGRAVQISYAGTINDLMRVEEGETVTKDVAKIRQGIAYALDARAAVRNYLGSRVEEVIPWFERTHFGDSKLLQDHYPDLWDKLPQYGPDPMPDKAAEAFRAAGLTKDGDTWMTPSGDPFELELQTWSSKPEIAVTAESNLKSVGVEASLLSMDDTKFVNNLFDGSFGVVPSYVYSALVPPETESIEMLSTTGNAWAWKQHSPPGKYELPEIGDMTGDPVETLDADEVEPQLKSSGMSDHAELGKKAIWAASYHLPNIPLFPGMTLDRFNENHFEWPGPAEKYYTASDDDPMTTGVPGRVAFRGFPEQVARPE